ncbi:MAG: type II toxin-antitoxin system VapC family toxin [Bifidobacteriaceae bacterium]|nr:type II toxin-antitoxin system VapC family toxin [Bifidobacteriaceae bacterium]
MIGLDTSVLVRHLTDDDPVQSPRAHSIFEALTPTEPGFISITALVETQWVLRRSYGYSKAQVEQAVHALLASSDLVVEAADSLRAALGLAAQTGADFADCLIQVSGARRGCSVTYTFDRRATRLAGMAEPAE